MEKKEAQEQISKLVAEAYAALEQATKLADEHDLYVEFDLAYGAGATYCEGEWTSSSSMC